MQGYTFSLRIRYIITKCYYSWW